TCLLLAGRGRRARRGVPDAPLADGSLARTEGENKGKVAPGAEQLILSRVSGVEGGMSKAAPALFCSMIFALAGQASAAPAPEEPESPTETFGESVDVESRGDDLTGIAGSAGEGVVGRADLEHRPLQRPGEILETVPGMVVTQHSGGGKAN